MQKADLFFQALKWPPEVTTEQYRQSNTNFGTQRSGNRILIKYILRRYMERFRNHSGTIPENPPKLDSGTIPEPFRKIYQNPIPDTLRNTYG